MVSESFHGSYYIFSSGLWDAPMLSQPVIWNNGLSIYCYDYTLLLAFIEIAVALEKFEGLIGVNRLTIS